MRQKNQKSGLIQKLMVAAFAIIVAVCGGSFYVDKEETATTKVEQQEDSSAKLTASLKHTYKYKKKNNTSSKNNKATASKETTASRKNNKYYAFRNEYLRNQHYKKHGVEMGFSSAKDYEKAAAKVIKNKKSLHKIEKEDGDDVYYLKSTNEFVIVSTDGYIRTYFQPSAGMAYYNRQ